MTYAKTRFAFASELGARLRQLRKARGLSLRDLAVLMDRHSPFAHRRSGPRTALPIGDIFHPWQVKLLPPDVRRFC